MALYWMRVLGAEPLGACCQVLILLLLGWRAGTRNSVRVGNLLTSGTADCAWDFSSTLTKKDYCSQEVKFFRVVESTQVHALILLMKNIFFQEHSLSVLFLFLFLTTVLVY